MAQGGPRYRNKKQIKTISSPHKGGKLIRATSLSFSLTFSDNESVYNTSEDNSGLKTSDCDRGCKHRTKRNDNSLQVIHTMNTCFQRAVDYRTYLLDNKSLKYDQAVSKDISKMSKHMPAQIKPHTIDPFGPVLIIAFLCNFTLARKDNGIHEKAAMWLFLSFLKKSASSP